MFAVKKILKIISLNFSAAKCRANPIPVILFVKNENKIIKQRNDDRAVKINNQLN